MKLFYTLFLFLAPTMYAAQATDDKEDKTSYHQLAPLPTSPTDNTRNDSIKDSTFSLCDYLCCCFYPTVEKTTSLTKGSMIVQAEKRRTRHGPLR